MADRKKDREQRRELETKSGRLVDASGRLLTEGVALGQRAIELIGRVDDLSDRVAVPLAAATYRFRSAQARLAAERMRTQLRCALLDARLRDSTSRAPDES